MDNDYTPENLNGPDQPSGFPEGDGVIILSPDRRIMSANLQAEKIFKMRFFSGQPLNLTNIKSNDYLPNVASALEQVLAQGQSYKNIEAEFRVGSDTYLPLVLSADPIFDHEKKIIGAVLIFRRRIPVRSIPEPEDDNIFYGFDTLFDQMEEGVFTINSRWKITAFNNRAQEITGFNRQEVLGNYCWDIFKSDLCKSNCPLKRSIETGSACMDQDIRIIAKDGGSQSILVNTSAIINNNNRVVGAIETFRPLTMTSTSIKAPDKKDIYFKEIIGQSPQLKKILRLLPDVAASEATVLIEGEPGTGKELIAKTIHRQSNRSDGPFITVNCSALSESMFESELFGHAKGAFTGAVIARVGKFELAKGGTIFLDEVGEIKPETQTKLLRVLEEQTFERVAGIRTIHMDARIIAATNKNLATEVREGRFREDLYYKLRTVPIHMPPLRERKSDIPLLIKYYLAKFNKKFNKKVKTLDPRAQKILNRFSWPGNIRELERILEYAFVFVKGPMITASHLPKIGDSGTGNKPIRANNTYLWEEEKSIIENVLKKTKGRRDEASRILGMSRTSLWRKMKAHGLL